MASQMSYKIWYAEDPAARHFFGQGLHRSFIDILAWRGDVGQVRHVSHSGRQTGLFEPGDEALCRIGRNGL
jgi:hypothetical protein